MDTDKKITDLDPDKDIRVPKKLMLGIAEALVGKFPSLAKTIKMSDGIILLCPKEKWPWKGTEENSDYLDDPSVTPFQAYQKSTYIG